MKVSARPSVTEWPSSPEHFLWIASDWIDGSGGGAAAAEHSGPAFRLKKAVDADTPYAKIPEIACIQCNSGSDTDARETMEAIASLACSPIRAQVHGRVHIPGK